MNDNIAKPSKKTVWSKVMKVIFTIPVLICFCFPIGAYLATKDISMLGYRSFIVLTGSMSPDIDAGSYVIVKEKQAEDIKVGDVITYRVDSSTILTHRVVEVCDDDRYSFITKGDANNVPDGKPVTEEQIVGVVVFWVNGLGAFLIKLRQPEILITIVVLMCVGVLASEVLKWIGKKRTEKG